MSFLRLSSVTKRYEGPSPVLALRDVDLTIEAGEFVSIEGPSGSGKSTLLNILALLDTPSEGTYEIDGERVENTKDLTRSKLRSRWFSFVFQSFHLIEARTVLANVELGLLYRKVDKEIRTQKALEAIEFVGLKDKAYTKVTKLSGGQRQRVAIARAVAAGAPVLVADEPTGSLDSVTSNMVMEVFERLNERGVTIVLVTHDPRVAKRAKRNIKVFDGKVTDGRMTESDTALGVGYDITDENISDASDLPTVQVDSDEENRTVRLQTISEPVGETPVGRIDIEKDVDKTVGVNLSSGIDEKASGLPLEGAPRVDQLPSVQIEKNHVESTEVEGISDEELSAFPFESDLDFIAPKQSELEPSGSDDLTELLAVPTGEPSSITDGANVTHDSQAAYLVGDTIAVGHIVSDPSDDNIDYENIIDETAHGNRIGKDSAIKKLDGFKDAWASLTDSPKRTFGMVTAVALGVAMSLATIGIGESAASQVSASFDAGRNTKVLLYTPSFHDGANGMDELISDETFNRLKNVAGVENVKWLIGHEDVTVTTTSTDKGKKAPLYATVPQADLNRQFKIQWATHIHTLGESDILVGSALARDIALGPIDLSPSIRINGRLMRVSGLIEDAGLQIDALSAIVTPEAVAKTFNEPTYGSVELVTLPGAAQQVAEQANIALWPRDPDAVSVDAPPDPELLREDIEGSIQAMLYTLTGVSILAAIVALTNAMTTAVSRRIGEFGLRRAMGARRRFIATLVATESALLGALGGIFGSALALIGILVVTIIQRWQPVFDFRLIPAGLAGGVLVGVISSLAAMFRAASIEPADALRR